MADSNLTGAPTLPNGWSFNRSENQHGHVKILLCRHGAAAFECGMDQHGGMHIHPLGRQYVNSDIEPHHRPLGYLYADESPVIYQAIGMLLHEHEARKEEAKSRRAEWQRTCRDRTLRGFAVDLSPAEVFEALSGIEVGTESGTYGKKPTIRYKGKWISFGRTSLADDISTSRYVAGQEEAIAFVESLRLNNYGARVREYGFFVVDALSDG